jgi:hypothetical protein
MDGDLQPQALCQAGETDFLGWQAVRLSNDLVELVAAPAIGGRVMALNLAGYPFLWVNEQLAGQLFSAAENQGDGSIGAWKNYGGDKTWPAPQGWENEEQWHGPPDPVLDTGRYTVERIEVTDGQALLALRSLEDPRTGIQLLRQFSLRPGSSQVHLHVEMQNVSQQPRTWAIWEIVQLDATRHLDGGGTTHNPDCWIYVPVHPQSRFPRGYQVMFGAEDNPEWQPELLPGLLGAQYLYQIGKIGVDSPAGWVAFANQSTGYVFCQRFAYDPTATYPDQGATVEIWTTGLGEAVGGLDFARDRFYHMEAEVLGPLRTLAPGAVQSLEIDWAMARCPGPIVDVNAGGCCSRPLALAVTDNGWHITGVFGVFYTGTVELLWRGQQHEPLARVALGAATPLQTLIVDAVCDPPAAAVELELRLLSKAGSWSLGACALPVGQ